MRTIIYSLFILLSISIVSCGTTKYITKEVPIEVIKEIPIEVTKTEHIISTTTDSTFVKDSIDRSLRGDTLVIYREKQIIKYKYKADTLIIKDTIPLITKVEVPVPIKQEIKEVLKLPWYLKAFMYIGIISLACIVILLFIKFLKK